MLKWTKDLCVKLQEHCIVRNLRDYPNLFRLPIRKLILVEEEIQLTD